MRFRGALQPLADRRFFWFFAARLISTTGSAMAPVALVFAVLAIADSPVAVGQVLAARSIPMVLLLLVAGVVADRLPRPMVLAASHLASFGTQALAAYLVLTGRAHLGQLIVLEAANGVMTAFTVPAIQGLVPQVVDRSCMQQANALLAFTRGGIAALGPAAAGVLVVTVGPGWALAFDALTWLVAGLLMLLVRVPRTPSAGTSLASELRSGWSQFRAITWLWTVVVACGVLNALYAGAWLTLGPVVVKNTPGLGEEAWGFAVSAEALGLLVFTVVMMHARVERPLRTGMAAMLGLVPSLFALAVGAPLWVLLIAGFLAGAGVQVFMIAWQTAIHENVPERYLSRISAYDALGSFVAMPVGQLAVGPLARSLGEPRVLVAAGVLFTAVVLGTLGVPAVWQLHRSSAEPVRGSAGSAESGASAAEDSGGARTASPASGAAIAGPDRIDPHGSVAGGGRVAEGEPGA